MSGVTELEPPATDLITLTRHILSQQHELGERASGDLTLLLVAIQVCPSPSRICSSGWSAGCRTQDKAECTVWGKHHAASYTSWDVQELGSRDELNQRRWDQGA